MVNKAVIRRILTAIECLAETCEVNELVIIDCLVNQAFDEEEAGEIIRLLESGTRSSVWPGSLD